MTTKLTKDELEALSICYRDADIQNLDVETWTQAERSGDLIHSSGAKVQMTGPTGRWVAKTASGRLLRGNGRGIRYFKRPTSAIAALNLEAE